MNVQYEVVVETTCCGRPRLLSQAVLSIWQFGLVITASYRCKDSDACAAAELDAMSEVAEPFRKVLAN